jgi:putative ABC transport system permease protein
MLLTSALMVGTIYTSVLEERRRELGLLLAVGMRPSGVIRLILGESVLTTVLGGVGGVVLGLAGVLLFQRTLGYYFETYQAPFSLPPVRALVGTGLRSVGLCAAVGLAGAALPAWRAVGREPYDLVRGEGT